MCLAPLDDGKGSNLIFKVYTTRVATSLPTSKALELPKGKHQGLRVAKSGVLPLRRAARTSPWGHLCRVPAPGVRGECAMRWSTPPWRQALHGTGVLLHVLHVPRPEAMLEQLRTVARPGMGLGERERLEREPPSRSPCARNAAWRRMKRSHWLSRAPVQSRDRRPGFMACSN